MISKVICDSIVALGHCNPGQTVYGGEHQTPDSNAHSVTR